MPPRAWLMSLAAGTGPLSSDGVAVRSSGIRASDGLGRCGGGLRSQQDRSAAVGTAGVSASAELCSSAAVHQPRPRGGHGRNPGGSHDRKGDGHKD
jgi:hypothetical protein